MREALVIIDMQQGFDEPVWGQRNNPDAERNGLGLLELFRARGHQVIFVRHDSLDPASPLRPGQRGHGFKPGFEPRSGEWVFGKHVRSAFIGTDLKEHLRAARIGRLTIFGITTDQCVSTTVRMASDFGFTTILVENACACFSQVAPDGARLSAEMIHKAHITSLHTEFARVLTARDIEKSFLLREGSPVS